MTSEGSNRVTERRDVSHLDSNDAVEEEIDKMLDISPDERPDRNIEESTDPDTTDESVEIRPEIKRHMEKAQQQQSSEQDMDPDTNTEVEVSAMAEESESWESFDFENQDWDSIDTKEPEMVESGGIKFLFKEPEDDDNVLNNLEQTADASGGERMRAMIEIVVAKPEITDSRWKQLTFAQKLDLAGQSADYLGLDDDFLDG